MDITEGLTEDQRALWPVVGPVVAATIDSLANFFENDEAETWSRDVLVDSLRQIAASAATRG